MKVLVVAALVLCACGGTKPPAHGTADVPVFATTADRILPLLPDGAQVIVEVDLARLRGNPVIGALVTQVLTTDVTAPLPTPMPVLSLAHASTLVMASYGVGTSSAATVIVLATEPGAQIPNSVAIADNLVALGPAEWTAQIEARAAIAGVSGANLTPTLAAPKDLRDLRDHAMPGKAPGASLRVTARLAFDARVALGRATGLEAPPAQLSLWGDVVDDLVIVVDLDSADPGDKKSSTKRMEAAVRALLAAIANEPSVRALGLSPSLESAELKAHGTWLRAIIAVGPKRLGRSVDRAKAFLAAPTPAAD